MVVKKLVPEQEAGAKTDVVETAALNSEAEAEDLYQIARKRLLKVYEWDIICDLPSAEFVLMDASGETVRRYAAVGDYFKIDLPAPGNATGDGFDWVKIENIEERSNPNTAFIAMQVRPCRNPLNMDQETAHFFEDKATSTFIVRKNGRNVFAEVHGRNEIANTETGQLLNNIRNALIAWGAKFGFSFPQWKSLVVGILKRPD